MRPHLYSLIAALALTGAVPLCAAAADNAARPGTVVTTDKGLTYYVQGGDTLLSIASRFTGNPANWSAIASANRVEKDVRMPIGTVIVIPASLLPDTPATAKVAALSGPVFATSPQGKPLELKSGTTIEEGTQIETGNNGFISITLQDASRFSLPSNSRIKLTSLRIGRDDKRPRTELTLTRGQVESRVKPLGDSKGRFEVKTPLTVAGVRGTHFRVHYGSGRSATEVLEGKVQVDAGQPGELVASVHGAIATAGKVDAQVPLLPAPDIVVPPGGLGEMRSPQFNVVPLADATAYHVQIAADEEGLNVLSEALSTTPVLKVKGLRDGTYYVLATAIDRRGLEGMVRTLKFTLKPQESLPPVASAPKAEGTPAKIITFRWPTQANMQYNFQAAKDSSFTWLINKQTTSTGEARVPRPELGIYYARVQTVAPDGSTSRFSPIQPFTVTDQWVINEGDPATVKEARAGESR